MKKKIFFIFFVVIVLFILFIIISDIPFGHSDIVSPSRYLTINDNKIFLQLARNEKEWNQGLSNQKKLGENSGMLFIFPDYQTRNFWMKDMNFSLDIVWIKDDKIVKISENLAPEGSHPQNLYYSDEPVNYVLELNANFCKYNNINVGDRVKYNL
jgi:uncharacterized protein